MIAPLRRRHGRWILGVALFVPPVVLWAYASRPEIPTMNPLPGALAPHVSSVLGDATPLSRLAAVARVTAERGERWLELEARPALAIPDPLVYWISGTSTASAGDLPERLPEAARLLGAWDGRAGRFLLPASAGAVWLYALGHQQVLDVLEVPAAGSSREAS